MREIMLCLLNVVFMSVGQIVFRFGMRGKDITSLDSILKVMFSPIILFGIFIYGLTTVLWCYILSKLPLTTAYPIQALAFPLVLLVSTFFLNEPASLLKWLGVFVIVIGVLLTMK